MHIYDALALSAPLQSGSAVGYRKCPGGADLMLQEMLGLKEQILQVMYIAALNGIILVSVRVRVVLLVVVLPT